MDTKPSTSGQISACTWNNIYTPSCEWPPNGKRSHPVVCVDWCDAYAYCEAVGKRLCGKIGGGAINAWWYDTADASKSQWYAACSSGGTLPYPYGEPHEAQTCNGYENDVTGCNGGTCTTAEVGTHSGCSSSETGDKGIYDLSGNVWEWENWCPESTGQSNHYRVRGGSFSSNGYGLRCDIDNDEVRGNASEFVGFRCCSSP